MDLGSLKGQLQTEAFIEPMDAPKGHRYDLVMRSLTRPYPPEMHIRDRRHRLRFLDSKS